MLELIVGLLIFGAGVAFWIFLIVWIIRWLKRVLRRQKRNTKLRRQDAIQRKTVSDEIEKLQRIGSGASRARNATHKKHTHTPRSSVDHYAYAEPEFMIHYVDVSGNTTSREIGVLKVSRTQVRAFCHLRSDVRTFLIERIQGDIICLNTGEVYSKSQWLTSLRG